MLVSAILLVTMATVHQVLAAALHSRLIYPSCHHLIHQPARIERVKAMPQDFVAILVLLDSVLSQDALALWKVR